MGMSDGEWEPAIVEKWFPCSDQGKLAPFYQKHLASADDLYWWEGNDEDTEGWYCSTCFNFNPQQLPDKSFASRRRFIDEVAELDEDGLDNLTQEVEIWRSPLHKHLDD